MNTDNLNENNNENKNPINNWSTQENNIRKGNKYRISVLTERLVRLEYSENGIFNDLETELVKNRNFDNVDFEVTEDNKFLVIKTKYFVLSYQKEKKFEGNKLLPTSNLKVELVNTDKTWYYKHAEAKNFKGCFVTLDGTEEESKAQNGLYSLDGFVSIIDNENIKDQKDNEYVDIYLFMYNKDFKLALRDYFNLTNLPSMIPRYSLGNWWSKDYDYTSEEILELVSLFNKEDIPVSVILLDKGWHIVKDKDNKDINTGYTFNKELINDPKAMIEELHKKNVKLGLKLDPKDGIMPHEENYNKLKELYKLETDKIIAFDPLNNSLLNTTYKYMLEPLRNIGVDFFGNDIEPKNIKLNEFRNLNNNLYNNELIYNKNKHTMILSRNGLVAAHRIPIVYTGRNVIGWDMLKKIPMILDRASNIGVSFISNDVFGNYGGIEESELYIRTVEQAVFSPILRFNAPRGRYYRKEPWRWDAKTSEVISMYLKLRHKLIPYLYTKAYEYHKFGNNLITPIYYDYPWTYDDIDYKNEYFFGDMLVSPILNKKDT